MYHHVPSAFLPATVTVVPVVMASTEGYTVPGPERTFAFVFATAVGLHGVGVSVKVAVACGKAPMGVNVALDAGWAVEANAVIVPASSSADKLVGAFCIACPPGPGMLQLMIASQMVRTEKSARFLFMLLSFEQIIH